MTYSVERVLDEFVVENRSIREPDGRWHPSSLFGCERQAVYEVRGTEASDAKAPRNFRIMRLGTEIHTIIQSALGEHDSIKNAYIEVPISNDEFNITGHADALIEFQDGHWELIEIKSISVAGFKWGKELPKVEHVGQARTYAYFLRRDGFRIQQTEEPDLWLIFLPLKDALKTIRMVYVSRDDMAIKEFSVNVSTSWEKGLELKLARLERYRADGVALPPRLEPEIKKGVEVRAWLCDWCPWMTRCWKQDPDGVEL